MRISDWSSDVCSSDLLVVFALIAVLLLFGWPLVQHQFFPAANPPVTKIEDGKTKVLPQPSADPAADAPAAVRNRQQVLAETPRVAIDTPALSGSINLKGPRIAIGRAHV